MKPTHQLAFIEQVSLYGVCIDLRKASDVMDRGRCLQVPEAYGVDPKMLRVIRYFWDHAVLVCCAGGVVREPFRARRGVTQDDLFSPRIFNMMVDNIVREWPRRTVERCSDDRRNQRGDTVVPSGMLRRRWADSVEGSSMATDVSLDTLGSLFEQVGLRSNTSKRKTMVCVPDRIRTCHSREVYNKRMEGHAVVGKWKSRRVECDMCGKDLAASSLRSHLETQHDVHSSFVLSRDLIDEDRSPVSYHSNFSSRLASTRASSQVAKGQRAQSTGCTGTSDSCTR